jgi:hypothetical protein
MRLDPLPWSLESDFSAMLWRKQQACDRLVALADRLEGTQLTGGSVAATAELMRATKTFRAVLLLVSQGFGQQALALSVSIYESALAILWAERQPERADRLGNLHTKLGAELQRRRRRASASPGDAPEEPVITPDEEVEARSLFGDECRSVWTGHTTLAELANEVADAEEDEFAANQLRILFDIAVRDSEDFLHATGRASLSLAEGAPDGGATLTYGPSKQLLEHALLVSSAAYLWAIEAVIDAAAPEHSEEVNEAYGLLWRASKRPRSARRPGRYRPLSL